ncbi:MAG: BON domain-containing protein [Alphaproteobacteria bacterium]|nr:BON domain-containing protein [Alphaproteobacteria bacterium]
MRKSLSAICIALLVYPLYGEIEVVKDGAENDVSVERADSSSSMGIMKPGFIKSLQEKKEQELKIEKMQARRAIKEIEMNSVNFLKFKEQLGEIFISNSDVADVDMLNDRSLYLSGKAPGITSLVIMSKEGKTVANYQVRVTYQIDEIKKAIAKIFPAVDVNISSIEDNVMLQGKVPSPEAASDIKDIVSKFIKPEKIINKMTIETSTQVMLKVKVAEVSRDLTKSLGLSWRTLTANNGVGSGSEGARAFMGFSHGNVGDLSKTIESLDDVRDNMLNITGGSRWVMAAGVNNLAAFIDALASESYAYVLAEPNLVALSGKSATFKSGGEYGYTVKQSTSSDANTTEFKDWGTSVTFTPVVMSEDRISITVKAEVSTIKSKDDATTPSLETKNVETVVELGSGQSLALAGLLQTTKSSTSSESPLLSKIPWVGALFRNSTIAKTEKELVIIVTPYIVKPASKLKAPTDFAPKMVSPLYSILQRKFHQVFKKANNGFSLK